METTVQKSVTARVYTKSELTEKNANLVAEVEALLNKGDHMMEEDVVDIRERLDS
mgnify:CR=1 FL=1